jgi:hypothetical protein
MAEPTIARPIENLREGFLKWAAGRYEAKTIEELEKDRSEIEKLRSLLQRRDGDKGEANTDPAVGLVT